MLIILFLFCLFVVIFSIGVVTSTNPIYSILSLILTFVFTTFIFLILGLEFIAIIFLIVYVGAIAVLFLFVVMMLNIKVIELEDSFWRYLIVGLIVGTLLFFQVLYLIFPIYFDDLVRSIVYFKDNLFYVTKVEVYGNLPVLNEAEFQWQCEVYRYWNSVIFDPAVQKAGILSWKILTPSEIESIQNQLGISLKPDLVKLVDCDPWRPENFQKGLKLQSKYIIKPYDMFDPSYYEFSSSGQISGLNYSKFLTHPNSIKPDYVNTVPSSVNESNNLTAEYSGLLIIPFLTFTVVEESGISNWFSLFFLDNTTWLGLMLYTYNFFVFMVISLILLIAMISSIVLVLSQNINLKRQLIFKQVSKSLENSISLKKFK